jgi:Rrf2 family nitric oxide-sensitive transcriptional repressor
MDKLAIHAASNAQYGSCQVSRVAAVRLTRQTDYALRTLIYLAMAPGERARVGEIAGAYGVSHHHLTKVVQQLQRSGFVETHRGQSGGVALRYPPAEICIGTVVRRLESHDQLVECFSDRDACRISGVCRLPLVFRDATEAFMATLDNYSLEDLCAGRMPGDAARFARLSVDTGLVLIVSAPLLRISCGFVAVTLNR